MMNYRWIRVGDPALSKLSRGVWGGLFILCLFAYWSITCLSIALYVGAYILGLCTVLYMV